MESHFIMHIHTHTHTFCIQTHYAEVDDEKEHNRTLALTRSIA